MFYTIQVSVIIEKGKVIQILIKQNNNANMNLKRELNLIL